ncbi:MAG TPA: glycosyltransferase family 2 protein [Solirubrobacteraceae bacterium]|jgi:cellulose synthase (UDP-forming)|nr:glycosyltransferase family 2 protein [Solirubrobacteraceae bacterium]
MPTFEGQLRNRLPRPRMALHVLGWALCGLPMPRKLPDHPDDTATVARSWGSWWARHPNLLRLLAGVALCWSTTYLAWRIGWSWHRSNPVLWASLLVAECYGLWNLAALAWLTWDVTPRERPQSLPGTSVDVYICTYDEAAAVLEATLAGCALMSYPHTTWLLDDGARPEIAELAREWGACYMTRPDKSHAKAGNINHALAQTEGELVLVLDADHVPLPDALETMVGYFEDPRVALVQTPHDFSNHDSIQHYGLGRHEQSVFFSAICVGKDRHDAAFWCGSCALMRREALLSIGGVATDTIAEDFHTTIKLHRRGWRTHYDDRIIAQGRAPHDLAAYLLQRDRWARGNLAVFTTPESPLRARELTMSQRMSYLASLLSYLAGPMRLLMVLVLAAVLWTGALPVRIAPLALITLWAPATLLMVLAGSALCRGQQSSGEATHYELCTAEIFTRALRCVVRPGRASFRVTPKEGVDRGGWEAVRQFRVLLVLASLLAVGLVLRIAEDAGIGPLPMMHGFASWFVPLLGAFELRRIARTLAFVARRRQLRGEYRTPITAGAVIVPSRNPDDTSPSLLARMQDITTSGVGFELSRPLPIGMLASLTVQLPDVDSVPVPTRLEVAVRSCLAQGQEWRIGATIVGCKEDDRRRVLSYCNVVWPYRRLRGESEPVPALSASRDQAIASVRPREATLA